jgi:hypothetical protein
MLKQVVHIVTTGLYEAASTDIGGCMGKGGRNLPPPHGFKRNRLEKVWKYTKYFSSKIKIIRLIILLT